MATILIISSTVKRSLWRASPLARGARFYSGPPAPPPPPLAPALLKWLRNLAQFEFSLSNAGYSTSLNVGLPFSVTGDKITKNHIGLRLLAKNIDSLSYTDVSVYNLNHYDASSPSVHLCPPSPSTRIELNPLKTGFLTKRPPPPMNGKGIVSSVHTSVRPSLTSTPSDAICGDIFTWWRNFNDWLSKV